MCQFQGGYIADPGSEVRLGVTSTEEECAELVKKVKPGAMGVTFYKSGRDGKTGCYAEFVNRVGIDQNGRYCFFEGRIVFPLKIF